MSTLTSSYQPRDSKGRFLPKIHMTCDQCELLAINGTACHEHGCPNAGSRWDNDGQCWIKQRTCFECGCTVDIEDLCCSAEDVYNVDSEYEKED